MEELNAQLAEAQKNLRQLKKYAISRLQDLIDRYGENFPRRTEIRLQGFDKIDVSSIALNNIRVGWDKGGCYIGTNVKSDDVIVCNEYDHLLCIERKGGYKIIDIPDKIFIDRLYEFRKYDKTTMFGIVYSDTRTGKVYAKRTVIDKFIKDKDYRICPEHCRLEMITPRANAVYECRIDTPIRARQIQTINLMDAPLRSPHAGGALIFPRKLLKITFLKYLDETDGSGSEPNLIEVPDTPSAVADPAQEPDSKPAEAEEKAKPAPQEKSEETASAPAKKSGRKAAAGKTAEKKSEPESEEKSEDDENWGISQPELGF